METEPQRPPCEMCGQIIEAGFENEMLLECLCATQQAPEFYVYEDSEQVWAKPTETNFYVMRCGEMKYFLYNNEERDDHEVIRYTSDFFENNIRTDEDINALLDAERLECINNPWFEIFHDQDESWEYGDVFFELDTAITKAIELGKEKGFMV